MKNHEIALVVNQLRDTAIKFRDAEQLRARIAEIVVPLLQNEHSTAASTPAAQSAGQEAVVLTDELVSATLKEYQLALQTDPRNTVQMRNSPTWPRVVDSMQKGAMREALTFALGRSAVPVNGGESGDGGDSERILREFGNFEHPAERAADAPQVDAELLVAVRELIDAVAPYAYPTPDKTDTVWAKLERVRAALSSPAKEQK